MGHSIQHSGSNEDLYEFLNQNICTKFKSPTSQNRKSFCCDRNQKQIKINAMNVLQKHTRPWYGRNGRWHPPNYDIDLNGDSHSFLSPKLSAMNIKQRNDKNKNYKKRKKGPIETGRIKGFKPPKYKINDDNNLFLETYRSWYPTPRHSVPNLKKNKVKKSPNFQRRKTTQMKLSKIKKNKKRKHIHSSSNGINLQRNYITKSCNDCIYENDFLNFELSENEQYNQRKENEAKIQTSAQKIIFFHIGRCRNDQCNECVAKTHKTMVWKEWTMATSKL